MVDFKKCLHQVSRIGPRKAGYYRNVLYKVRKTVSVAANYLTGSQAEYDEVLTEISGDMVPFIAKRWGAVTEDYADFVLATNERLAYDEDDDTANDQIQYKGVRYKIINARHFDRLAYDDCFDYALKRIGFQGGKIA